VPCKYNLYLIFILEFEELYNYLQPYEVYKFEADEKTLKNYLDGGVAIIDQIICSQAK
jgi:hypothetical protein